MSTKRILIVRPDHLGDLILSLPVAEILKGKFPESYIAYFAAPGPAGVGDLVDYVDHWILDSEGLCNNPRMLAELLSRYNFDAAIELKPSWRTSLAIRLAGIQQRVGTSRRFYSFLYNRRVSVRRRGSGLHQTDLDLELLRPFGINVTGRFPKLAVNDFHRQSAQRLVGESINPYIIIHPGSSGSAPNWPESNYWILARLISEKTGHKVVITGQEKYDTPIEYINLGGKTGTIGELAGVIASADCFISGNTGPLHLADAFGLPCISFMIRHPEIGIERWGPRRNIENVLMPEKYCHCADLKYCRCLETISPESAFDKLDSIIGTSNR